MFKKKSLALIVSLVLVLTVTVGTTLAYLIATSGPVENTFTPSKVTTEVVEEFDETGKIKQNVKIQNTGDTDAWIRATYIVTWQDADGNVYGQKPVAGTDYEITYGTNENGVWLPGGDDFYYWSKPVAPEAFTGILIGECKPLKSAPEDGYYLCVEILGSGIQRKPATVFNTTWDLDNAVPKVTVAWDGSELTKEN